MIKFLQRLLGKTAGPDLGEVIAGGALIVDVRTPAEYAGGHLKNSINIPLNILPAHIDRLRKDRAIITCCASGMRSASARSILQGKGFTEVYNGGSWHSLKKFEQ